ncbi:MAG TPA: preprotein translocase subunit SecG [Planctomycetota bacterium]|nr:preprotein translocase subunit SecG [Planctomycetota bacterium]
MLVALSILFAIVCLLLIFMVVITPSQSEGLAGAFGGMGSDTFFGTKAGQHINRFTIGLAVSFLVLAVLINIYATRRSSQAAPLVPSKGGSQAPAPPPPGQP